MDKYWFSSGGMIDIQNITITPNTSAKVQALCYYSGGNIQMKFIDITGDEYNKWLNDDNYLIALVGHKLGMGERVQVITNDPSNPEIPEIPSYKFQSALAIPSAQISASSDTQSVHNEADIQRIQTLQEQLDEQKKKLETITQLLFKNGSL